MTTPARRAGVAGFSLATYLVFAATFLYMIGFMGGFPVPRAVDGAARAGVAASVAIDLLLLALFGLQHSVMARAWFKASVTRRLPAAAERSLYVLASSAALALLFGAWHPLPATLWSVEAPAARLALWAVFWSGWALALVSSFLIDHFELFGLSQGLAYATGHRLPRPAFRLRGPYRVVRHPILLAFLLSTWSVPHMTAGHALFSAAMSLYIVIGMRFEERDLARAHPEYADYRRRVPALVPLPRRGR